MKVEPVIIVDTREQRPLPVRAYACERAGLKTGDYSVKGYEGEFAVERKSIPDLVGCCGKGRERFKKQIERLRGYEFRRLLVIGRKDDIRERRYRSLVHPRAVAHTLLSIDVNVPVVWCDTPKEGAEQVERWAWWFVRDRERERVRLEVDEKQTSVPAPASEGGRAEEGV
ncbi:MAG: hypothetical protein GY851_00500 [bacterium]|nr:hypothetical protein [bacterium]